jgi:DNA-binding MarR family transcriptional regulator
MLAELQASMTRQERIAAALAAPGNLFFVLTQPELRREGISFLALYALQRVVKEADDGSVYSEQRLRSETGLKDYEASRACRSLVESDLATESRHPDDHRVKLLAPTARGRRILTKIVEGVGQRLWHATSPLGRVRRMREVTGHLREADRILHGDLQLTFFDNDLLPDGRLRTRAPESQRQSGLRHQASRQALGDGD